MTCRWCRGTPLECARTDHESDFCPATVYGQRNLERREQGLPSLTFDEAWPSRNRVRHTAGDRLPAQPT